MNTTAINEVLEIQEVPNFEYDVNLMEMDLECLRETIVDPMSRKQVYRATTNGINIANWSPYDKRLFHLVSRKIFPSANHTDMTFPQALLVACAIKGIKEVYSFLVSS